MQSADCEAYAPLNYQTERLHWRRGVATRLAKDLIGKAGQLGVPKLVAQVAIANLISFKLLRRAGLQVEGWAEPARPRQGTVDCLELSLLFRTVAGSALARAHVQLPA